jgi:hypothetical protein
MRCSVDYKQKQPAEISARLAIARRRDRPGGITSSSMALCSCDGRRRLILATSSRSERREITLS